MTELFFSHMDADASAWLIVRRKKSISISSGAGCEKGEGKGMYPETVNLHEIMKYWGHGEKLSRKSLAPASDSACAEAQETVIKCLRPDSPRIVAEVRAGEGRYILKGIPAAGDDGEARGEQTIRGNASAHLFLGNRIGIAPRIFPVEGHDEIYYLNRNGYWFYLTEYIEGRPMQATPEDEFLLGRLARRLHSLKGYSLPSALDENKRQFYEWFREKPFKPEFDALPDFAGYDRCFIHSDLGPHNTIIRENGEAVLVDLDDAGMGSRYLDLGWAFIMQFVERTENMRLSYRFDLAQAFLKGYYGTGRLSEEDYELLWQGAVYMHISYMQSYGPGAVDSLWKILRFGLAQKPRLWEMTKNGPR